MRQSTARVSEVASSSRSTAVRAPCLVPCGTSPSRKVFLGPLSRVGRDTAAAAARRAGDGDQGHRRESAAAEPSVLTGSQVAGSGSPTGFWNRSSSSTSRSPLRGSWRRMRRTAELDWGPTPRRSSARTGECRRRRSRRGARAVHRTRPDRGRAEVVARGWVSPGAGGDRRAPPGAQAQASIYAFNLVEQTGEALIRRGRTRRRSTSARSGSSEAG